MKEFKEWEMCLNRFWKRFWKRKRQEREINYNDYEHLMKTDFGGFRKILERLRMTCVSMHPISAFDLSEKWTRVQPQKVADEWMTTVWLCEHHASILEMKHSDLLG